MSKPGKAAASEGSPDPVLRAKHLDYCSARMAEVLLRLSADEMYLLAQDVIRERAARGEAEPDSFDVIVRLATEKISRNLDLPDFETWAAEYRKDPALFEREMLGLWEGEFRPSGTQG